MFKLLALVLISAFLLFFHTVAFLANEDGQEEFYQELSNAPNNYMGRYSVDEGIEETINESIVTSPVFFEELEDYGYYEGELEAEAKELSELEHTNGSVILQGNFTPDGQGELLDSLEDSGIEFITFESRAGHTYFLIIDRNRTENNVYFLAPVTELSLLPLAEQQGINIENISTNHPQSGIPANSADLAQVSPILPTTTAEMPEIPIPDEDVGGGIGAIWFIVLAPVLVAGYMLFKMKKKKSDRAKLAEATAGTNYDDEEYNFDDIPSDEDIYNDEDGNASNSTATEFENEEGLFDDNLNN